VSPRYRRHTGLCLVVPLVRLRRTSSSRITTRSQLGVTIFSTQQRRRGPSATCSPASVLSGLTVSCSMGGIKLRSSSLKTYRQFSVAFPMLSHALPPHALHALQQALTQPPQPSSIA